MRHAHTISLCPDFGGDTRTLDSRWPEITTRFRDAGLTAAADLADRLRSAGADFDGFLESVSVLASGQGLNDILGAAKAAGMNLTQAQIEAAAAAARRLDAGSKPAGLTPAVAAAASAYSASRDAFVAACAAYDAEEQAIREGGKPEGNPDLIAADALQRAACDASLAAWAAFMQVEPQNEADLLAYVRAFHEERGVLPDAGADVRVDEFEGAERRLRAHIERILTERPAADCPVAALIPELEGLLQAEMAAGDAGDENTFEDYAERRDRLMERIADMQATSQQGAILQAMVGMFFAELVRGTATQGDRDHHHGVFEKLMRSAMSVFSGSISPLLWLSYVGGPQPGGRPAPQEVKPAREVTPDDATRFLNLEQACLEAIQAMDVEDEDEHERWYNHASILDELICRLPGRGATVAEVKLRRLHCPKWGLTENEEVSGRDWALAVRTALSAMTGEGPEPLTYTDEEMLRRLRDAEVEVTSFGFHFPNGCHGAAPYLLGLLSNDQAKSVMALAASQQVAA